ncbi:MAG: hypothetical protein ACREJM_02345 [Candidatus Saccharimonadales bacterium]
MTGEQVLQYLSCLTPDERKLPFIMEYENRRDEPDRTHRVEIEGISVQRHGIIVE